MANPSPDNDLVHGKLVHLATYADPMRAAVARGVLEQQGVRASIGSDTVVTAIGYVGSALGGVRLYVNECDKERALQLLAGGEVPGQDADDMPGEGAIDQEVDDDFADETGGGDDDTEPPEAAASHPMLKYAFRGAVFGVFFAPFVLPTAYSIYLICRHQLWRSDRGGNDWRYYVAMAANLCAVVLARIFYS